jgi:hypothetical protein
MNHQETILDHYIALERNAARLYRHFRDAFPVDADFWWQLAQEEENHASLLRSLRDYFPPGNPTPATLLGASAEDLVGTAKIIDDFIVALDAGPFTRRSALERALRLETLPGELEFQQMLEAGGDGRVEKVLTRLCGEDRDHALRIEARLRQLFP